MSNRVLVVISVIGILLSSIVTLSAATVDYIVPLSFGALLGWIPYLAALFIGISVTPPRFRLALAVGLLPYLVLDLAVRYKALHNPTSSTDAIAIIMVLFLSVVIIPAGTALTYLILRAGQIVARKIFRR